MMRRFAVLVVVACVGLAVPAVAASASPLPDLTCGPITTSVHLRDDLTCPNGLQVADADPDSGAPALPPELTIDLGGHTLTTPPTSECESPLRVACASIYVTAEHTTVNIRNGSVSGDIVYADGNSPATPDHPALGGVVATTNVGGEVVLGGLTNTLRKSSVDGDVMVGGFGVAKVVHDTIHQGVFIEGSATIDHNLIFGRVAGTDLCANICGPEATITANFIVNSPGDGISFDLEIAPNEARHIATISGNVIVQSAGAGISLSGFILGSYTVTNNWNAANAGDGLQIVVPSGPGTTIPTEKVNGNTAVGNGGHGFNIQGAPTTFALTAKNNTAFSNATDPQCIGLVCLP